MSQQRVPRDYEPRHPIETQDSGESPTHELTSELDLVLFPDGTVVFSWNTPDIQTMAQVLGTPEFEEPRWCG